MHAIRASASSSGSWLWRSVRRGSVQRDSLRAVALKTRQRCGGQFAGSAPCWLGARATGRGTTLALAAAAGMEGTLFRYRTSPGSLQAFMSPAEHAHARYVIYLGGLTDGLLACGYVEELAAECDRKGWAFVQPVIRSSYAGYGCSSLANDVVSETLD